MVDRGDDVEFELAIGGGLEDACVDLDLFDGGAKELFEGGDDAGFLAGARGAVDKKVRKITTLGLVDR